MALLKDAKDFASRSSFEVQHTMYSSSSTLTYILTTYLGTINVLFSKNFNISRIFCDIIGIRAENELIIAYRQ